MPVTENEKSIYNLYLATSRSHQNKPFKLRKNFDKFENTPDHIMVKKICYFFSKFPHIDKRKYFEAPYKIYSDIKYLELKFYTGLKAVKAYSTYMTKLQLESPDNDEVIAFIKESLRFIAHFCVQEGISLDDYITYKKKAVTYTWMTHLKNHNISSYTIFMFPKFETIIDETPKDEQDLFLNEFIDQLSILRIRFHKSKKAKHLIETGYKTIKRFVEKNK